MVLQTKNDRISDLEISILKKEISGLQIKITERETEIKNNVKLLDVKDNMISRMQRQIDTLCKEKEEMQKQIISAGTSDTPVSVTMRKKTCEKTNVNTVTESEISGLDAKAKLLQKQYDELHEKYTQATHLLVKRQQEMYDKSN